jgi:hypothetical protein
MPLPAALTRQQDTGENEAEARQPKMLTGTRRAGSLAASAGAAGGEMKTRAGREGGRIPLARVKKTGTPSPAITLRASCEDFRGMALAVPGDVFFHQRQGSQRMDTGCLGRKGQYRHQ